MLQGRAGYGKFGLEVKQPWDAREFANLDAKVIRKQVTYGPEIF